MKQKPLIHEPDNSSKSRQTMFKWFECHLPMSFEDNNTLVPVNKYLTVIIQDNITGYRKQSIAILTNTSKDKYEFVLLDNFTSCYFEIIAYSEIKDIRYFEWFPYADNYLMCVNCGLTTPAPKSGHMFPNYCPHCGCYRIQPDFGNFIDIYFHNKVQNIINLSRF